MSRSFCTTFSGTIEDKWSKLYGTNSFGNLPEFKRNKHKGNKWNPCPFSTECSDLRSKALLGLIPNKVSHVLDDGSISYLSPVYLGGWGYMCTYSGCSHLIDTGKRYFYK